MCVCGHAPITIGTAHPHAVTVLRGRDIQQQTRRQTLLLFRNVVWRALRMDSLQKTVDSVATGPHGRSSDVTLPETDEDESRFVRCHPPSIPATRYPPRAPRRLRMVILRFSTLQPAERRTIFSKSVGNNDEVRDVPPKIPGTVTELRDTTLPPFQQRSQRLLGQEALDRPMESVSEDPEGMLSLLQAQRIRTAWKCQRPNRTLTVS